MNLKKIKIGESLVIANDDSFSVTPMDIADYEQDVKNTEQDLEGNPAAWVANEALWEKAKRASKHAFDEIRWPFVTWWYLKQGGKKK